MATSSLFPIQRELASNLITIAVQKLGYKEPKKEQIDIIHGFMNGRDVFGILPTGFGKSLCYPCLPILFDELFCSISPAVEPSIIIVVTLLIAIMNDQIWMHG